MVFKTSYDRYQSQRNIILSPKLPRSILLKNNYQNMFHNEGMFYDFNEHIFKPTNYTFKIMHYLCEEKSYLNIGNTAMSFLALYYQAVK